MIILLEVLQQLKRITNYSIISLLHNGGGGNMR